MATKVWSVSSESQDLLADVSEQHANEEQRQANKQTCRKVKALPPFNSIHKGNETVNPVPAGPARVSSSIS